MAQLERNFQRYVTRTEMDPHAIAVAVPKPKKPERERAMAADEVHLMLARIRPWDARESILAAGEPSWRRRARIAGPNASAELHYWSGVYAMRWRRFDEAERELRAAMALEPRPRAPLAGARPRRCDARRGAAAARRRELEDAVARLVPLATSAHALDFLARYYSGAGSIDAGLPYARRAVAIERGCWECEETLSVAAEPGARASAPKPPGDESAHAKPTID